MNIVVASLTLRFYLRDGWTVDKVKSYLVNKKHKIDYRESFLFPECSYFAVYEKSGYKIFKKELLENEFDNKFNTDYKHWYIR